MATPSSVSLCGRIYIRIRNFLTITAEKSSKAKTLALHHSDSADASEAGSNFANQH
jgi:hypothetical protein